ncbi:TPA: hypothetical protein EYH33_05295 [Candidatus Bipolaricaulota bacterium]|nr:hypothetical protein [Candidatus Bipolaricaulota bacterium]
MRILILALSVSLGVGALAGGIREAAEARLGALVAGDLDALVGAYAPGAEALFLGAPRSGFIAGDGLRAAWEGILAALHPVELGVEDLTLVPEAGVAFARVSLGEGRWALWALAFGPDGRVVGEDFLLYGLPGFPQPPVPDGAVGEGEYPHAAKAAGVEFYFLNGTVILFGALRAPGTGWVAVGFDPDFRMQGADMVFAWVDDDGATVEDHYGSGPTSHRRDEISHILLAAGGEAEGVTTVEFVKPLSSGDPEDKPLERGKTYTVILAYHRSYDGFRRHTARGRAEITLD